MWTLCVTFFQKRVWQGANYELFGNCQPRSTGSLLLAHIRATRHHFSNFIANSVSSQSSTLIAQLVLLLRPNPLVRGSISSLGSDIHRQHGLVSGIAQPVPRYIQFLTWCFFAFLTFCTNQGGIDIFSWQVGPRWWQMRAQSKAQDLFGHVQTVQAYWEVVNLRCMAILCGTIHVAATCILPQKTTRQFRFSF